MGLYPRVRQYTAFLWAF
jgi:hypothetical protein